VIGAGRRRRPRGDRRAARAAAVAGVLLFWAGALAAGALAPGYSARADHVSSLAGRGSQVAVLGIAALVALALAHLAAAAVAGRPLGWPLAAAGAAGLVVAGFRTGCPLGAAGCGTAPNDAPPDLADVVHGFGVVGYEVALVAAMALVAARRGPRAWRLATAAAAVASVLLLLQTGDADTGAWQRAWLLVNTAWLAATALREGISRRR
jgi:hypothetical protein